MSTTRIRVEQWKQIFRAIGLDDNDMRRWHREFERRHPQGHQDFLEWLGLPAGRIADIRRESAVEG